MSGAIENGPPRAQDGEVNWLRTVLRDRGRGARTGAVALGIGLVGWAYGTAVMWAFTAILRSLLGRSGMTAGTLVAHLIGPSPGGAVTGFAASMGVPVHWQVALLRLGGWAWPAGLVAARPWLAAMAVVPLLSGVLMGWLAGRAASRYQISVRILLAASAAGFALISFAAVLLSDVLGSKSLLSLAASPAWALPLAAAWAIAGGSLGLAVHAALARRRSRAKDAVPRRAIATAGTVIAALLAFGAPVITAGVAEAAACPGTPSACSAGTDPFLTAMSPPGTAGLGSSGPTASQITSAGYQFQGFLNAVQEPWMVRETNVYWQDSSRMIQLMQASPALAQQAAATLQTWEPALNAVGTPAANRVVITQAMVDQASSLANAFINTDLASPIGGGALAQSIQTELSKITPDQLTGLTVNQAINYLNQHIQ